MKQYVDKEAIIAEIESNIKKLRSNLEICKTENDSKTMHLYIGCYNSILSFINTLEVKEIENSIITKHSYFESIYHCGSEPRWKIDDVLAVYEFYSDYEGGHVYGKITDVKMDEDEEDWCYTFENGDVLYENMLISDETYKKN